MTKIYLDHAATTPLHPGVLSKMQIALAEDFANPSAMYDMGIVNEKKISEVRALLAKTINASPEEMTFTSGGTEGDNTIIRGVVEQLRPALRAKARIITTQIEHPAVSEVFKDYQDKGLDVVFLPVDHQGQVDQAALKAAITPDTVLVSIIGVHNETGTIQDLVTLGNIIKTENPNCIFHSDYVQGYMKIPLDVKKAQLDAATLCAHKICGPKGIGAVYLSKGLKIKPLFLGGGQEKGLRSGTENVPGIVGFGEAAAIMSEGGQALFDRVARCKQILIEGLSSVENLQINSPADGSPYVVSLSFAGLRGEVLLHALEAQGVYVSTGSACSTHKKDKQSVLRAMGIGADYLEGTIRVSFSCLTTEEEVRAAAEIMIKEVEKLRNWLKLKRR